MFIFLKFEFFRTFRLRTYWGVISQKFAHKFAKSKNILEKFKINRNLQTIPFKTMNNNVYVTMCLWNIYAYSGRCYFNIVIKSKINSLIEWASERKQEQSLRGKLLTSHFSHQNSSAIRSSPDTKFNTHVVYGMGQKLLFWKLKNLNKLLVFEALYP